MELKDVVSVAGKPGLHKIIGKGASGLVLEALDGTLKRTITPVSQKVSILEDISVYTVEGDSKLADVFMKMDELDKAGNFSVLPKDASGDDIKKWFETIVTDFDKERVYNSDIQKIANWYNLLKGKIDFTAKPVTEEAEGTETADKTAKVSKSIKPIKKVEAKAKTSKGVTKTTVTSRKMS